MNTLASKIEAILFLSARPVSYSKLGKLLGVKVGAARAAVDELAEARNIESSGVHVIVSEAAVELGTNPAFFELIQGLTKSEFESELTRPQLETLTIIAYRGPITKPEIEHIRGVNCSLILRNLLMRGLVIERDDKERLQSTYVVSTEMLRALGLRRASELPDYSAFHENGKIGEMLESLGADESE